MIKIMVAITSLFIACFTIIMFFIACLMGITFLDYLVDSDLKGWLQENLGDRTWLKKLRKKILDIFKKYDTPSRIDLPTFMPEDIVYYTPEEIEQALTNDILTDEEADYLDSLIEENPDKGELVLTSWSEEKKIYIMDIFNKSKTYRAVAHVNSDGQHIIEYERIG